MQRYLLRRLLLMVPTLLGVSFVVFVIVRAVPGDIVDLISGDYGASDPAVKEAIRKEFGLEGNIVSQYVRWLGDIVQFDMGESLISGRTVTSELSNRMPVTFQLGFMAIIFSLIIAVPIGIISAIRQDTWADYAGRSFAIGLYFTLFTPIAAATSSSSRIASQARPMRESRNRDAMNPTMTAATRMK